MCLCVWPRCCQTHYVPLIHDKYSITYSLAWAIILRKNTAITMEGKQPRPPPHHHLPLPPSSPTLPPPSPHTLSPFLVFLMTEYPLIPNPGVNFRFVRPVRSCVAFSHQRVQFHTMIFSACNPMSLPPPQPWMHIVFTSQLLFTVNKIVPPNVNIHTHMFCPCPPFVEFYFHVPHFAWNTSATAVWSFVEAHVA